MDNSKPWALPDPRPRYASPLAAAMAALCAPRGVCLMGHQTRRSVSHNTTQHTQHNTTHTVQHMFEQNSGLVGMTCQRNTAQHSTTRVETVFELDRLNQKTGAGRRVEATPLGEAGPGGGR